MEGFAYGSEPAEDTMENAASPSPFGREVTWSARTHVKGASGPLLVTKATLQAIGVPAEWLDKSKDFLNALEQEYPALAPGFPDRKRIGSGEGS